MANIKSAIKRARQALENQAKNRAVKSGLLTASKALSAAVASGDKTVAMGSFRSYASLLDKAVKRGVITANTAARSKARASKRLVTA